MSVIPTKYFDIIFSEETAKTAKIISENADDLYLKAKETIGAENEIRIVVVISPDSDIFSVTYTPSPYNRIVLYDAVSDSDYFKYDQILLDAFYHEVLKAVGQSIRNPVIDKISKFMGMDILQPAYLFNLPSSFIEGIASLEDENENVLNDSYNMQILMQAKLDGKFPSWINAVGSRDIYPGDELTKTAGIAFAAYLQQRFGFQKYLELWEKSGNVYFLFFTQGIFFKVYGEKIGDVWNNFIESIPLPEISENVESKTELVFENDLDRLYSNLLSTSYGLVWYDDLNHAVILYNPDDVLENRKYLFFADEVTKLSVDDTGQFLSVSFKKNKMRENLRDYRTKIYDLKNRSFFSEVFDLNDACIVKTNEGLYAVAGVNVQGKYPKISIVLSEAMNTAIYGDKYEELFSSIEGNEESNEIFSRDFGNDCIPYSLASGESGVLVGLLNRNAKTFFYAVEFENIETEKKSEIAEDISQNSQVSDFSPYREYLKPLGEIGNGIDALQRLNNFEDNTETDEIYTFRFFSTDSFSFAKVGFLSFDVASGVHDVMLQKDDFSGGVYSPVFFGSKVYFCSKKTERSVLRQMDTTDLIFEELLLLGTVEKKDVLLSKITEETFDAKAFKMYNPLGYLFHGTWMPMLPVRDLKNDTGNEFWPGLGVSYITQADPLENNELTLSAAFGYAKLDYMNLINPTEESLKKFKKEMNEFTDDFSTSVFFKNTTTPIDISAGGIFKFKTVGEYNLKFISGADWVVPLGMSFRKLSIGIDSSVQWSTKYTGVLVEEQPDLKDWPSLNDSYNTFEISASAKYSSMNQAGISPYEQRGLEASAKFYMLWDFTEIKIREPENEVVEEVEGEESTSLSSIRRRGVGLNASLISFSASLKVYAPRLNPLPDYNGWILGIPTSFSIDVFKDNGTAFSISSNSLLIGKEIQYGIPVLNLYLTRVGFTVGYDLDFDYEVKNNRLPDIRSYKTFSDIFANTVLNDKISFGLDFVFSPTIGIFSKIGLDSSFKVTYGIRTNEVKILFNMKFLM